MSAFSHLQDLLILIFKQYKISKAVLFGSMAKNTDTEKSDLDLLVYSNLHGLQFVGFMEEIRQAVTGR